MSRERQATSSSKGYILQGHFGIYFFFKDKNYKNIKSIKIEGSKEDIEINYYDNSKDFIQVKTHENPSKNLNFDYEKFRKGIKTLYEAFESTLDRKVNRLILANNMFNQGIKRLNNKIREGMEENFIYNLSEDFTEEEIEEFEKKTKEKIKDIFYLARVDETYLLKKGGKILLELNKITKELELQYAIGNISDSLKVLFDENSCHRILEIDKKQVAWVFIKNKITQKSVYGKFNNDFEKEMSEEGIVTIEMLVGDSNISDMIKNYSRNYEIYLFFQKKIEEYKLRVGRISPKILKEVMIPIAEELYKTKELCIGDGYSEEEEKFIYYFFTYFLYFNNKNIKRIYDEFDIKETEDEVTNFDN